ncbi:hypothetical protein DNK77_12485 [Enterobacter cloacae complex sp.]|uniref:phage tail fiber domain-containing protein n=1 Tax=Enterobacter cloacae complex sp. TaxID=2027919 RepID=UPI000D8D7614|nr:phage tail fiber protein [Enterobacter cloacae complex sp.]PYZ32998.1 hypothetical protein DNK77_12485 [Enterobacter cloacae complex sp.]
MSVPNQTPYIIYNANGLTTVFPFEFYIINAGDIQVSLNGEVITTGYSVSGVGNIGGGGVTFLTPPANGTVVMLERVVPTYRLTDYQDNGDLLADTVNKDFDRLWMAIQRAFIYLGLALRRPLFGGPFDAEGYRIANLADPVNEQDAATKKWVQQVGQTNFNRTLRVPENYVNPLAPAEQRRNRLQAYNNEGQPIFVLPGSGTASEVLIDLASSEDGKGDALIGVKQPFTGAIARTQHDVNADMVINVKDVGGIGNGSASSAADIAAVQAAINAYPAMRTPVHVKIPRGTWNLSGITIPRRGVVLDLTEATIEASSGVVFSRSFAQVAAADFKSANPPLDGNQTYFRPIVIKGGTVNLSGTATFLEIRQPYLAEYSIWGKTLIINDTQIKTYGTSVAFAIHGGWGFDLNSVAVTGDVTAATGYGASVGSGTCLYSRPDNSLNGSSHPQLISFNSCTISYCKVFDMARGSATGGSAEGLYLNNSNCMFVEGGTISRVNLVEFNKGMFVTTAKELYFESCAGVLIDGMQVQRYNNPRGDGRYGEFQFIGGGSEIKISNCRPLAGGGVTGTMFGFRVSDGEEFLNIQISNIQYVGEISNVNETDQTKTTSVVRTITGGTGKITGMTINNVSARGVHNILDFGDLGTTGSINRLELKSIRNIGSSVKQRVRGLNENISNIYAPEMYAVNFIRMRAGAVGNTATICSYENFRTQITGSTLPVASISNNTPVSNAVSISVSSWDNVGNVILALNQIAGLTNGTPVECTATLTLNSSGAVLA